MSTATYLVALAGNPNVGKSTVFNALTGLNQHTGNWPGKTVGLLRNGDYKDAYLRFVDLPGTYSLRANSPEEEVARDFIVSEKPDVRSASSMPHALKETSTWCCKSCR